MGFGDCIEAAEAAFELDDEGIAVFREGIDGVDRETLRRPPATSARLTRFPYSMPTEPSSCPDRLRSPGTMRKIRTYHEVESQTGDLLVDQIRGQRRRLDSRLAGIRNLVAVGSGKGGGWARAW